MNPLQELAQNGQSVWLDFITRRFIEEGGLARLVDHDDLRGVTSNPTIFQKAIAGSADYDREVEGLLKDGKDAHAIYEALAVRDIQRACDALAKVYETTKGADGFVSLEVNPHLALDPEGTCREAIDLHRRVGRPNLMIKIPATREGLPAVERTLAEGISVNVTLIFSLERYRQVLEVWAAGIQKAAKAGKDVSRISSVASFFVSRVDSLVDVMLEENAKKQPARRKEFEGLMGKAAIANAHLAYDLFRRTWGEPAFRRLVGNARPQRPLWASTSTKNPKYRDVLYVEELIGKDTVNTLPPQTLDAFRDHGKARDALGEGVGPATDAMQALERAGIDMVEVTGRLEADGVKAFVDSYDQLLASIAKKRQSLLASR